MAIQKEIWERAIVEGLFASNSFLSKAFNADGYVEAGKIVHIPQAGAASKVVKNRTTLPATVKQRNDTDVTFELNKFTTDPVLIDDAEKVELSYDKRESVLRQDRLALYDSVAEDFLFNWSPESSRVIETTGEAALMTKFNKENIPQEGRYLLLDAVMYSQLLNSLTENENSAFLASADAQNGIIGKLFSFNVMMRSRAALYTTAKAPKAWSASGEATDLAAALAWHDQSVCRALGQVKAFEQEKAPDYYGDLYSFLVRAGGRIMRSDNAGVMALVGAATE